MDIPVYLIAGFLDAGKTSFINGVLRDGFAEEDRTLLICCEEGELSMTRACWATSLPTRSTILRS